MLVPEDGGDARRDHRLRPGATSSTTDVRRPVAAPGNADGRAGDFVAGTLGYMAPEQLSGERDRPGHRHLRARRRVLFESLTGELPFDPGGALAAGGVGPRGGLPALLGHPPRPPDMGRRHPSLPRRLARGSVPARRRAARGPGRRAAADAPARRGDRGRGGGASGAVVAAMLAHRRLRDRSARASPVRRRRPREPAAGRGPRTAAGPRSLPAGLPARRAAGGRPAAPAPRSLTGRSAAALPPTAPARRTGESRAAAGRPATLERGPPDGGRPGGALAISSSRRSTADDRGQRRLHRSLRIAVTEHAPGVAWEREADDGLPWWSRALALAIVTVCWRRATAPNQRRPGRARIDPEARRLYEEGLPAATGGATTTRRSRASTRRTFGRRRPGCSTTSPRPTA